MNKKSSTEALVQHLSEFVTENRLQRFEEVLGQRTRYVTLVLEDIFQSHNISAVLRSCECFGVQDVHIIENENEFLVNDEIALGSSKWLDINVYNKTKNNTKLCLETLKNKGYRIVATIPNPEAKPIEQFDIHAGKFALVMGTELKGITKEALEISDEQIYLPMVGFTESLNISVTAAIFLNYFTNKLRQSQIEISLTEEEKNALRLQWLRNTVKEHKAIEKRFFESK